MGSMTLIRMVKSREFRGKGASLEAETAVTTAEDAGTVGFRHATPDKVEQLRRILAEQVLREL